MKTLILSISAGGGHNAAGEAISDYIHKEEPDSQVVIIDTLKYISPVLDKVFIGTYLNSLKIYPKAYNYIFSASNKNPDETFVAIVEKLEEMISARLLPLIRELKPDIILATHPFTAEMANLLRSKYHVTTPNLVIITDYGIHTMWVHPSIDYYVVAHDSMIPELVERGRKAEFTVPLGIPVRSSFNGDPGDRVKTLKRIGLDPDLMTVTLMGGSLALGRIKNILRELDSIPRKFNIAVITANNEKLYDEAVEISLKSEKSIAVLKYCNFMNAMLHATDLLVTKPGGLTITEALISGTPMAIFSAIGGQEEQNNQFLIRNQAAIDIGNGADCAQIIENLLLDKDRLAAMSQRAISLSKPDSTRQIYLQMKKMIVEHTAVPDYSLIGSSDETDESSREKFRNFLDDFKSKVESNGIMSKVLDLVRRHDKEDENDDFYELSDDEVFQILEDSKDEKVKERFRESVVHHSSPVEDPDDLPTAAEEIKSGKSIKSERSHQK